MDADELLATLEYWQISGIGFLAGESLEFSPVVAINNQQPVVASFQQAHLQQPATISKGAAGGRVVPPIQNILSAPPTPTNHPPKLVVKAAAALKATADELLSDPVAMDKKPEILKALEQKAGSCQRCELHLTRNKVVFGVGNPEASVVFVGEGPGADEDRVGEPFVGAAGHLLDKMLQAIGFAREDIYIANVVKCRPPGNRNPLTEEMALCQHFLIDQLQTVRPEVIFCLGKFSLLCLLGYSGAVGKARGQQFSWRGIPVIASFHPAYYLRTPSKKNAAWQDLIRLQKLLDAYKK